MTGPQPPRVEFVPGVGVMVHTTRGDWMGVELDGGIRHLWDFPEGYLGAVSLVPASRLDDLAKAHAEHIAELRAQRDEALRKAAEPDHGTAGAMRFAAVEVELLEDRFQSYSTNIAELLSSEADRLDREQRQAAHDAAERAHVAQLSRERWNTRTPVIVATSVGPLEELKTPTWDELTQEQRDIFIERDLAMFRAGRAAEAGAS